MFSMNENYLQNGFAMRALLHFIFRQTTSFIDYSIEAGILLGGNGAFTP
jgi:hypothetical protein